MNVGRGNGTADRLTAKGEFRFRKICSRNEILEVATIDGKTGKFRVMENTTFPTDCRAALGTPG